MIDRVTGGGRPPPVAGDVRRDLRAEPVIFRLGPGGRGEHQSRLGDTLELARYQHSSVPVKQTFELVQRINLFTGDEVELLKRRHEIRRANACDGFEEWFPPCSLVEPTFPI